MKVKAIRPFIPSKDYDESKSFYQALGFKMSKASEDLSIFELGSTTFFLQRHYSKEFADNLMLQLIVANIEEAYSVISQIQGHNVRFNPIQDESWGRVIYLWGPSGELWHVTELLR